jgi:hypothetical protein
MSEALRRIEKILEDCVRTSKDIRQTCDEIAHIEDMQSARIGGLEFRHWVGDVCVVRGGVYSDFLQEMAERASGSPTSLFRVDWWAWNQLAACQLSLQTKSKPRGRVRDVKYFRGLISETHLCLRCLSMSCMRPKSFVNSDLDDIALITMFVHSCFSN